MKIKVIGKAHLKGTSKKTGNSYDFIQVHYNGPAFGVEGIAACTLSLDPQQFPYDRIAIGGEYNVEFGPRGYLVEFAPVKGWWTAQTAFAALVGLIVSARIATLAPLGFLSLCLVPMAPVTIAHFGWMKRKEGSTMSKPGPSHLDTDRPCSAYPKGCDRCRFRLFCFLASRPFPSPQPPRR